MSAGAAYLPCHCGIDTVMDTVMDTIIDTIIAVAGLLFVLLGYSPAVNSGGMLL